VVVAHEKMNIKMAKTVIFYKIKITQIKYCNRKNGLVIISKRY